MRAYLEANRLEGRSLSAAVTRMAGTVGALVSLQEGSELLDELAGMKVRRL